MEDLRIINAGNNGIVVNFQCQVIDSKIIGTGSGDPAGNNGNWIRVRGNPGPCQITGKMMRGSVGDGISGSGLMVTDNYIVENGLLGIRTFGPVYYGGNVNDDNNGGNANPQAQGTEIGPNICGGDTVCP